MEDNLLKITVFCCASSSKRLDRLESWLAGSNTSVRRISTLYELLYKSYTDSPELIVISIEKPELPIDKVVHELLEISHFTRIALLVPSVKFQELHFLSETSPRISVFAEDPQGRFVESLLGLIRMQYERKPDAEPLNKTSLGELVGNFPEAFIVLDGDLRIIYANQKMLDIVDVFEENYIGKSFVSQLDETSQTQTRNALESCLNKIHDVDFLDLRLKNNRSEVIPCRASYAISELHKKPYIQLCIKDETASLSIRASRDFQDQFERYVMQLSTEILGASVSELPGVMVRGLKELSSLLSFNRLQVVALASNYSGFQNILCWPQNKKSKREYELNWLIRQVFQKGKVSIFDTHTLPLDAMEEFDWLRGLKMHALAAIPINEKDKETGVLLAFKNKAYNWSPEDFGRLKNISNLINSLLSRLNELKGFRKTENELVSVNKRLSYLARKDGLTGLANRRMFDQTLSREIRRSARQRSELSLLLTDIDFFKRYNDKLGHVAGDKCLKGIGACIDSVFQRAGDLPARYGGEEFAIILAGTNKEKALAEAERLKEALAELNIAHPDSEVSSQITLSIGITTIENSLIEVNEFIEQADKALYSAKEKGRNIIVHFEEQQQTIEVRPPA